MSYGPFWIDTTPPGIVGTLGSETHPQYACTDQPEVAMFWSHAGDDNCGMAGYSYTWSDGGPGLPDEYADTGMVDHLTTTVGYSDAARYFNIRAVDVAGNPSGGYTSHGPIWVDQVPGAVAGLQAARQGSDLQFAWDRTRNAHYYRVYKDVSPAFPAPVQVGSDTGGQSLVYLGGAMTSAPIEFFRVDGTNVCGKPGPL
jgi:hypothetical protein